MTTPKYWKHTKIPIIVSGLHPGDLGNNPVIKLLAGHIEGGQPEINKNASKLTIYDKLFQLLHQQLQSVTSEVPSPNSDPANI